MTDDELARIRADAERVAAAKAALVGKGHTHDSPRWLAANLHSREHPGISIWYVTNDATDLDECFDLFEDPPEEFCKYLVALRNLPLEGHVLALLAEVERLAADRAAMLGLWVFENDGKWQIASDSILQPTYPTREEAEAVVLVWAHWRKGRA